MRSKVTQPATAAVLFSGGRHSSLVACLIADSFAHVDLLTTRNGATVGTGIVGYRVRELRNQFARLQERGLGILITDHNVRETLKLVDRAYLIHKGEVVYHGLGPEMPNDPKAREIYLGPEFNL